MQPQLMSDVRFAALRIEADDLTNISFDLKNDWRSFFSPKVLIINHVVSGTSGTSGASGTSGTTQGLH